MTIQKEPVREKEEYVTARLVWEDKYYGEMNFFLAKFRHSVNGILQQDASGKKIYHKMDDLHTQLRSWIYMLCKLAKTLNISVEESEKVNPFRWKQTPVWATQKLSEISNVHS